MQQKKPSSSPVNPALAAAAASRYLPHLFEGAAGLDGGGILAASEVPQLINPAAAGFSYGAEMVPSADVFAQTGATNFGASGLTEAPGISAPTGLGTLGTVLGGAAALHGGLGAYQAYKDKDWRRGAKSGAEAGAGIGALVGGGPVGALVGAPIGAVVAGGLARSRSGKSGPQKSRDESRKMMEQLGLAKKDASGMDQITFDDGTSFAVGTDGHARLTNADGGQRQFWDADLNNPETGNVIGALNPLGYILGNGDKVKSQQSTGMLTNAAMAGGDPIAHARELYARAGIDAAKANEAIAAMEQSGTISADEAAAFRNGVGTLLGGQSDTKEGQGGGKRRRQKGKPRSGAATPAPALHSIVGDPVNTAPDKDAMARAFANVYLGNQGLPAAY